MASAYWYGQGMRDVASGTVDLNAETFGMMLLNGSYTFTQDTHHFRSDVNNEVTGSGYTIGGNTITNATITYDAASNEVRWDFDNPQWTTASFTASQGVIYKRAGGTSSADPILIYVEFGTQTVTAGTFTYQVPSTGAGAITVAAPA